MHTPGPYTVHHFADEPTPCVCAGEGDIRLATMEPDTKDEANLFAAAPDLLEALKDLYYFADGIRQEWEADNPNGVYNPLRVRHLMAAKQAVAKAEGKDH